MDSFSRRLFVASILAGSFVAVGSHMQAADVWTPPENPNPSAILNEAQWDTADGRYHMALAKLLWFHHHALEYEPAQVGVRLSFALSYWKDLAEKSPPALAKLKATRDDAGKRAVSETGKNARSYFHDFVALNKTLNESDKSVELFLELRQRDPDKAKRLYHLAEAALIKAKKYDVCGEYIDADKSISRILRQQEQLKKRGNQLGTDIQRILQRQMTEDSATLVGLLVVNERQEEAEKVAAKLKVAWDDKGFHEAIDAALAGVVPAHWP